MSLVDDLNYSSFGNMSRHSVYSEQRNKSEKVLGISYPNMAAGPPFSSPFRGASIDEKIYTKSDRITHIFLRASCFSTSILVPMTFSTIQSYRRQSFSLLSRSHDIQIHGRNTNIMQQIM